MFARLNLPAEGSVKFCKVFDELSVYFRINSANE